MTDRGEKGGRPCPVYNKRKVSDNSNVPKFKSIIKGLQKPFLPKRWIALWYIAIDIFLGNFWKWVLELDSGPCTFITCKHSIIEVHS